ncbi:MAG TPA: cupin domain-containing protein [Capsulimonadaceae bacterium]|nr:cupin domain-containing protein [Capsulimonadaceae bacterium]
MATINLAELEEYRDQGFAIKKLYKGEQTEAAVIHLKPGQEVPPHPHDGIEVTLLPQKGHAQLNIRGEEPVPLRPGLVHYESAGSHFGIVNDGVENFQMVVVLARSASNK